MGTIRSITGGPMAQLGARLNGIEKVVGSNPTGSTEYKFRRSAFSIAQEMGVDRL